jgi:hypothetical protein
MFYEFYIEIRILNILLFNLIHETLNNRTNFVYDLQPIKFLFFRFILRVIIRHEFKLIENQGNQKKN